MLSHNKGPLLLWLIFVHFNHHHHRAKKKKRSLQLNPKYAKSHWNDNENVLVGHT